MSIPVIDEQFLPRLVCVFYAIFHPTEGPKVVYQVPEGSIIDHRLADGTKNKDAARSPETDAARDAATQGRSTGQSTAATQGGDALFDFASLSEYLIPKAPLCGRLVACTARSLRKPPQPQQEHDSDQAKDGNRSSPTDDAVDGERSTFPRVSPPASRQRSPSSRPDLLRQQSQGPLMRGPTSNARSYKILGNPILIEDAARYRRNNFIFNLCFVFEGHSDVRAYEPVVRKCGRVLRGLEESQSFLSNPRSMPRVYNIIEQLYEDLNSYCESFVALPEAPYTSYILASSPQGTQKLSSPIVGPSDFLSLGASATSLRDESHRKALAQHLRQLQLSPSRSFDALDGRGVQTPFGPRSRAPSSGESPRPLLAPLSTIRPETAKRTWTSSAEAGGSVASSPRSPESALPGASPRSRRPTVSRSATLASIGAPLIGSAAAASSSLTKTSSEARFASLGRVSAEEQSELAKGLMASEGAAHGGGVALNEHPDGTMSARRSSGGSPGNAIVSGENHMVDSIASLQTIDAALSNSINALRHDTTGTPAKSGIAERREPPHGLGRTVRDAVNLKLFPTYPNPPPVNDWDVPVALLDLGSRVDGNWDLTMARIFPFIDGVNHVKRIAQLADAELGLTRSCIEHLLYYGCIIIVDIFQYFNMYTVRPAIALMADDEAMGRECASYVTRPGYPLPSYPELLRLYSLLRPGKNLHDWIEDNDIDAKGIDVRRFVSFGVIQGFLRRVRRYPVYLAPEPVSGHATTADGESRLDASFMSTVRDSPSRLRRDQSGSREPRDRRPRELHASHAASSSGAGRQQSKDSAAAKQSSESSQARQRTTTASTAAEYEPSTHTLDAVSRARTSSKLGSSPTKRPANRARPRPGYHHPTATVMDVASVAFEIRDSAKPGSATGPRSPRKRVSSQNIGLGLGGASHYTSSAVGAGGERGTSGVAGASGISHSQRSVVVVPPELAGMLDGTRCDDELCVHFGVSWTDLERMLLQLGTEGMDGLRRGYGNDDDSDDGGTMVSGSRGPDWRRGVVGSGVAGTSSGWSRTARMSGIGSVVSGQQQAARSGGVGGGEAASGNNATSRYHHHHPHHVDRASGAGNDSSVRLHSSQTAAGASGSGWGGASEDASAGMGWSGFGGLDRRTIEAGDLGRVKILLQ